MSTPTSLVLRLCMALLTFPVLHGYCQEKKVIVKPSRKVQEFNKRFQFSLFPGISTNGIQSGSFYNQYSLNLFGGLSRGNRILEFSPLFNAAVRSTTGIQLAGLANIVGANSLINLTVAEENLALHEDYNSDAKGIQFAAIMNYVRNKMSGIQLSGIINAVGEDMSGIQLGGMGNSAGGFAQGIQFAGLYNIARESMAGVQISSLFNYTDGALSGTQFALINKARIMTGRKTQPPTPARSLQVGIMNFSRAMDGVQIGLINFGGEARGKQIGLINFFSPATPHERVRNGTPVGLINIGSKGSYGRLYATEMFAANIEYTTGNCLNCSRVIDSEMPFEDRNQIFNQNALILGYDPIERTWGFGYGFQKMLYNKFTMQGSPLNRKRIMTYGLKFIHLNRDQSLDRRFNLVSKLNFDYGKRWRWMYWYVGVSMNYFVHEEQDEIEDFKIRSAITPLGDLFGYATAFWPGYELGLQF